MFDYIMSHPYAILLAAVFVLVVLLGVAREENRALERQKQYWKAKYYAAAQIRAKGGIGKDETRM